MSQETIEQNLKSARHDVDIARINLFLHKRNDQEHRHRYASKLQEMNRRLAGAYSIDVNAVQKLLEDSVTQMLETGSDGLTDDSLIRQRLRLQFSSQARDLRDSVQGGVLKSRITEKVYVVEELEYDKAKKIGRRVKKEEKRQQRVVKPRQVRVTRKRKR